MSQLLQINFHIYSESNTYPYAFFDDLIKLLSKLSKKY